MKWFVAALLTLNLALFGFLRMNPQFGVPDSVEQEYVAADVPSLVLLDEAADSVGEGVDSFGEAANQPVSDIEDSADRIAVDAPADMAGEASVDAATVAAGGANRRCIRVGPIGRQSRAEELLVLLDENGLPGKVVRETGSELRHWIHLRGAASREEARDLVAQLEERGFTDYLILNDPDELHTISLGVFRDRERSERLLTQLRNAHFPAGLSPRQVQTAVYWLEIAQLPATGAATVTEILVRQGEPGAGVVDCQADPVVD